MRYEADKPITAEQFIDVLQRSGLGSRRPVDDLTCMADMVAHASLTVTAWDDDLLIGVARSVTDFAYCCYLSDLAVDRRYQRQGIGLELIARTQAALGPHCKIVLLSAPSAAGYYPHIGMEQHPSAWILPRDRQVRGRVDPEADERRR
jgi:GNAT superfamily N-acetyltransferase